MSELAGAWVEPYDLFVSYSRLDDGHGMVAALVAEIEREHERFSPSHRLNVFFDRHSLITAEFWREKLRTALRQSKVLVAVLSENYFRSEYCRWEFEEFLRVEQARTYPGEALAPVFIVAPKTLSQRIPTEARAWWDKLAERHGLELQDFWSRGLAALRELEIEERIVGLQRRAAQRAELGRRLAAVPRKLQSRNPNFVGRRAQIRELREKLTQFEIAAVCAVHGIGGIGKSSLAREYAYCFRPEYLGGQFEIDLSAVHTVDQFQAQIVQLVDEKLEPIDQKLPFDEQFRKARAALESRPAHTLTLLILDNLNEEDAELLGASKRGLLLPSPEKVHVVVTTRLGPRGLGDLESVSLDRLSAEESLDVLFQYRTFARDGDDYRAACDDDDPLRALVEVPTDDAEWKAALAIANRLGRHTLAVAMVGAYLGKYLEMTFRQFLSEMTTHGLGLALDVVGHDTGVRQVLEHPQLLIGPLFERSMVQLSTKSPLPLRILEYAAFMPADQVAVSWLKKLVENDADLSEALAPKPFEPSPWERALRELVDFQFLTGDGTDFRLMHRVLQQVVRDRMADAERDRRETALLHLAERRASEIADAQYPGAADVSDILWLERVFSQDSRTGQLLIASGQSALVGPFMSLGRLSIAADLARNAEGRLRRILEADPRNARAHDRLILVYERLGNVRLREGNLEAARQYYQVALASIRRWIGANPNNLFLKRHESVLNTHLGDVEMSLGNSNGARAWYEQEFESTRRLVDADPKNIVARRDLAISYGRMAHFHLHHGSLENARKYSEKGLEVARQLSAIEPHDARTRRNLGIAYARLGSVALAQDDLKCARSCYEADLAISQQITEADPHDAFARRSLCGAYIQLGSVTSQQSDMKMAKYYSEQGVATATQIADADPSDAQAQRDLAVSYQCLGDVYRQRRELKSARSFCEKYLQILLRLFAADPRNAQTRQDLSIAYYQLAQLAEEQKEPAVAENWFKKCLQVIVEMQNAGMHLERDTASMLDELRKRLGPTG